jgi:hypothetical protein
MSNKMWNISKVNRFHPKAEGQFYLSVEDLGSFGTKAKALKAAGEVMTDEGWWVYSQNDEVVVYRNATHEIVVESIYVA